MLLNYHIGRYVLGSLWDVLQPATRILLQPNHTESQTHYEQRT